MLETRAPRIALVIGLLLVTGCRTQPLDLGGDLGRDASVTTDLSRPRPDLSLADLLGCTLCPPGNQGQCVDPSSDRENCGGCGIRCAAASVCSQGACIDVAAGLDGLSWVLPCTADVDSVSCSDTNPPPVAATLAGVAGASYDVTLRFTGVIEQKSYLGGSSDGAYWQIGGAPANDGFNWYRLDVSSPKQTYYLNRGQSSINRCFAIDYTKTLRMDVGATITAEVNDIGGHQIKNIDGSGHPLIAAAAPPTIIQPYNGQFILIQVLGVSPP